VKGNIIEGLLKSWPELQLKIDMSNAGIAEENDKVRKLIKEHMLILVRYGRSW
jgi:hypothetical protein